MNKSFNEFIKLSSIEYYNKQTDYTSLYNLLVKCRKNGYYHIGYYIGKILEKIDDYRFIDELAVCAYWMGEHKESYKLCKKCLQICPEADEKRILDNKNFNAAKLGLAIQDKVENKVRPIKVPLTLESFKEQTKEEIKKLNYRKYWYQYNDVDKLKVAKNMKEIETYFLEKRDLLVYPVYGTLLGMIRDNDFIGWDTDIDMAYLSKYHTNEEVLEEFNYICKFLEERKLLRYRIKTASHLHVWSPSKWLTIDLWISWIDNNGKYHLVWTIPGDIDKSMILPFKTVEFKGQTFCQMNKPEQFLDSLYGDWNTLKCGESKNWSARKQVFELEDWHGK